MQQVFVPGLPHPLNFSDCANKVIMQPSTPLNFSVNNRLSMGPVTSSRPPSAMDAHFDDEVCYHIPNLLVSLTKK